MIYNKLYEDFKALFPNYASTLSCLEKEAHVDNSDGMHIFFTFVVAPFLQCLFTHKDKKSIQTAFDFFEKMATSGNMEIGEVLEYSILENLVSQGKDHLTQYKQYMGKETIACCLEIERYTIVT